MVHMRVIHSHSVVKPISPSFGILNALRKSSSQVDLSEGAGWSWRRQLDSLLPASVLAALVVELEPPFLELLLRGVDAVVIVVVGGGC